MSNNSENQNNLIKDVTLVSNFSYFFSLNVKLECKDCSSNNVVANEGSAWNESDKLIVVPVSCQNCKSSFVLLVNLITK